MVTTFALAIGLVVMNVVRPGEGIDATRVATGDVSAFAAQGKELRFVDFLTHIVPSSVVGAFAQGEILQVVFFSILFGVALASLGPAGRPVARMLDRLMQVFFRIVGLVMVVAPIGAFGAMAYTIGNFGVASLLTLGRLMACVYATMALFIFVVLNVIARFCGVQPVPPAGVHQGRDPDRPRHVVERGGAAPDAGQDGALRLRPAGGRRW